MLVIAMNKWSWRDIRVVLAPKDVETDAEKLDNRSSPFVMLMGSVGGGAANVRVQQ